MITPEPWHVRHGEENEKKPWLSSTTPRPPHVVQVVGAEIEVPTLDHDKVKLRLRPGTQSGSRHRVKGKGITSRTHTGDMIVTVDVVVPTTLSDAERAAVEQLADATTSSPRTHLEG